ncbi:carboxylesterase/lipase family protein [Paenibacillus amylolyticus]|uniref:carboxylesterase/lipase family protein n=1 Tax=Paenibacillus amylolyticus TaxID=1451 RepID=UPI00201E0F07|nr:carboxylesterase family protein [Paenibacillus amylolyticus]
MKKVIVVILSAMLILSVFVPNNALAVTNDNQEQSIRDLNYKRITKGEENNTLKPDKITKHVTGGKIRGYLSPNDSSVAIYKGIPYAAPPVGENRWRAPQDVKAWSGVKETREYGFSCMQKINKEDYTNYPEYMVSDKVSEDCLTLNIWTNSKTGMKANMPVVFYIHGGGWVGGGSDIEIIDGEHLASQDVIFVSVNYRLGVFGWFASSDLVEEDPENSSGNYGLMDVVKGLEWVNDNISAFGGDPNNVTIMGGSAGANLVNTLLVSPKAKGLFKHAFSMSYPLDIINTYPKLSDRKLNGDRIVENAGGLEALRNMSTEEVYNLGLFAAPCIDGTYVTKNFREALESGMAKDIDLITGVVWNDINGTDESMRGDGLFTSFMVPVPEATEGEVLATVLNGVAIAREKGGSKGKTYVLEFNHIMPGPVNLGAFHGSEIPYFLNYFSDFRKAFWQKKDYNVGKIASSYLINFSKTGSPNGKGLVKWNPSKGDYTHFVMKAKSEEQKIKHADIIVEEFKKAGFDFLQYGKK